MFRYSYRSFRMQYVARQPILDSSRSVFAYELLFRSSTENSCNGDDLNYASKHAMDTLVLLGLETVSEGHHLFLNCTEESLLLQLPTLFPVATTVIELLESVPPSCEVVDACRRLKNSGYRIALDDFVPLPGLEPLVNLADIIKFDLRSTSPETLAAYARTYHSSSRLLLAEKVETEEEFDQCLDLGFTLFQGYFFSRPTMLSTSRIESLSTVQQRAFSMLGKAQIEFSELDRLIRSDPALCYRLLRYLNSPVFYLRAEITSILQALLLLGEEELRKWLLLVCAVAVEIHPQKRHLLSAALARARFAELFAAAAHVPSGTMFMVGMLSLMDSILALPIASIAERLAISDEARSALLGHDNRLRRCLDLLIAYESADWQRCEDFCFQWNIFPGLLTSAYLESLQWASQFTSSVA